MDQMTLSPHPSVAWLSGSPPPPAAWSTSLAVIMLMVYDSVSNIPPARSTLPPPLTGCSGDSRWSIPRRTPVPAGADPIHPGERVRAREWQGNRRGKNGLQEMHMSVQEEKHRLADQRRGESQARPEESGPPDPEQTGQESHGSSHTRPGRKGRDDRL